MDLGRPGCRASWRGGVWGMGGMVLYGGKMGRKEEEWKRNAETVQFYNRCM